MAGTPFQVDLGPDDRARLSAESRRRGITAGALILELVRTPPESDAAAQRGIDALDRLKGLWQGVPEVRREVVDAALAADRVDLERRALGGVPR